MFGKPGGQFMPVARKYCVAHGMHSAFPPLLALWNQHSQRLTDQPNLFCDPPDPRYGCAPPTLFLVLIAPRTALT